MKIEGILETCLYVNDLDRAENFYCNIFSLVPYAKEKNRHVFFRLGKQMLLLFNPKVTLAPQEVMQFPAHGAQGPGHAAFCMKERDIPQWKEFLTIKGIAIENEIAWPNGGYSIYFRDPAGNSIELATASLWGIDEKED